MALTNNLLVNLDELDAIRPSQHAALKQTLSKSKVNGRPIFGCAQEDRLRFASFVASDAHDTLYRSPDLRSAYMWIYGNYSKTYAEELFFDNPEALISGQKIITRW